MGTSAVLFAGCLPVGRHAGGVADPRSLVAGLGDMGAGRYVIDQPDVAPNGATLAQCDAPKNGGTSVNNHFVFDNRVTGQTLGERAIRIRWKALGAKCHLLIDAHMVADNGGFANDHPSSVVDEEMFADGGTRVNVDAGFRMSDFTAHARQKGKLQLVKLMSDAVMDHRVQAWITQQNFVHATGGRVPCISRQGV